MSDTVQILPERAEHESSIEALLDDAFGPGRFVKTAYRLREGTAPVPGLSFVAALGGRVVGSVRFSPIAVGDASALLLGPLVVAPSHKNRGFGLALIRAGLEAAREAGYGLVILVGDAPYYARAGFVPVAPGRIAMPGPVDPSRLLAAELVAGALEAAHGPARPAPPNSATLAVPGDGERSEQQGKAHEPGEQGQRPHAAEH